MNKNYQITLSDEQRYIYHSFQTERTSWQLCHTFQTHSSTLQKFRVTMLRNIVTPFLVVFRKSTIIKTNLHVLYRIYFGNIGQVTNSRLDRGKRYAIEVVEKEVSSFLQLKCTYEFGDRCNNVKNSKIKYIYKPPILL